MSENESNKRGFWGHPLIILLVSAALSSWLIPLITTQIDHEKLIREARLKKALEILDDSADTERNLNTLLTTLAIFQKDNAGPAARFSTVEKTQKELRTVMIERYTQFDRQAWWWSSQIHAEAKILEIASPQELDRLEEVTKQYSGNVKKTTEIIDSLWDSYLRKKYKPLDPVNEELLNGSWTKFHALKDERSKLVMESSQIMAKKREGRLSRWFRNAFSW